MSAEPKLPALDDLTKAQLLALIRNIPCRIDPKDIARAIWEEAHDRSKRLMDEAQECMDAASAKIKKLRVEDNIEQWIEARRAYSAAMKDWDRFRKIADSADPIYDHYVLGRSLTEPEPKGD